MTSPPAEAAGTPRPSSCGGPVATLLGRGSIYTSAFLLQLSASLVTLPIITRLLHATAYGVVALALSVSTFVAGLAALGLPQALTRTYFEPSGLSESRQLVLSCIPLAFAATGLIEGVVVLLWSLGVVHHVGPISIAILSIFPGAVAGACLGYLRAAERARQYVVVALVSGVGGQFLGILLLLVIGGGPTIFLFGIAIGNAAGALWGLLVIRAWEAGLAHKQLLRRALALGLPLVPHSVAWSVLALGDRLVVQPYLGFAALGRYHVAYTLGSLGLSLITSMSNAWMPIVFGAGDSRRAAVFRETLVAALVVAAVAMAELSLLGPVALTIITPSGYHGDDLAPVVALVAASVLPWTIYTASTQILIWQRTTAPLAFITPIAAVANIGLVVLFITPFGLPGVALATLIAYTMLALFASFFVKRSQPTTFFTPVAVAVSSLAIAISALGALASEHGLWLGVRICLGLLVLCIGPLLLVRQHRRHKTVHVYREPTGEAAARPTS